VRFLNALIAGTATQNVFAFIKRDASNAQKTTQPLSACAGRNSRMSNAYCDHHEGNHPANYKDCMIYKDLQKSFYPKLRRKMIAPDSQPRTDPASIQIKLIQPGKSYASIIRTEARQPITSQNNQETQEKMTLLGPGQLVADAIQELHVTKEYMEKMSAMFNGLATLDIKITQ
jgi:hypothetical protein